MAEIKIEFKTKHQTEKVHTIFMKGKGNVITLTK